MKRDSIILLLVSLLLLGCDFAHYGYEDGTLVAIKKIPYYYRVEFEYTGEVDGVYYDHEKLEYFETEAPKYGFLYSRKTSYNTPEFNYSPEYVNEQDRTVKPAHTLFVWDFKGEGINPQCPLFSIELYALSSFIESGRIYEPLPKGTLGFNNNICFLSFVNTYAVQWNYSFTKVNDDDTIAYTLRLFATDPLSQPQTIQIDMSKKLMALSGASQNFQEFIK